MLDLKFLYHLHCNCALFVIPYLVIPSKGEICAFNPVAIQILMNGQLLFIIFALNYFKYLILYVVDKLLSLSLF